MPTKDITNNFVHLVSKLIKKNVWIFKKQKIKFDFKLSNNPVRVFLPHPVYKLSNTGIFYTFLAMCL